MVLGLGRLKPGGILSVHLPLFIFLLIGGGRPLGAETFCQRIPLEKNSRCGKKNRAKSFVVPSEKACLAACGRANALCCGLKKGKKKLYCDYNLTGELSGRSKKKYWATLCMQRCYNFVVRRSGQVDSDVNVGSYPFSREYLTLPNCFKTISLLQKKARAQCGFARDTDEEVVGREVWWFHPYQAGARRLFSSKCDGVNWPQMIFYEQ